jgi:hypothetical protein
MYHMYTVISYATISTQENEKKIPFIDKKSDNNVYPCHCLASYLLAMEEEQLHDYVYIHFWKQGFYLIKQS